MHPSRQVLIVIVAVMIVFFNTLWNDFAGDDNTLIVHNTYYSKFDNFIKATNRTNASEINRDIDKAQSLNVSGLVAFRPVLSLSYFLDSAVWGKTPFGFHLTNFLLHALNAVLVLLILIKLLPSQGVALLGALCFALHPVQSEPVSAIGFRGDLLSALGVFLAIFCWQRFREGRSLFAFWAAAGYGVAIFSKENAFLLPLWLLAYDRWKGVPWRRAIIAFLGFSVIAACYFFLYFVVFPNTALTSTLQKPWGYFWDWASILTQIWAVYLKFLFLPLTALPIPGFYYPLPKPLLSSPETWVVVGVVVALAYMTLKIIRNGWTANRLLILLAVLTFLPASGLIPNPNTASCRFLYLPSAGIMAVLASLLFAATGKSVGAWLTPQIRKFLACTFLLTCAIFSIIDNRYWKNDGVMAELWTHQFPDHFKGHQVSGLLSFEVGDFAQAARHFERAAADSRNNLLPETLFSLGLSYTQLGQMSGAWECSRRLDADYPWFRRRHYLRGLLFYWTMDFPNAKLAANEAVSEGITLGGLELLLQIAEAERDFVTINSILSRVLTELHPDDAVKLSVAARRALKRLSADQGGGR